MKIKWVEVGFYGLLAYGVYYVLTHDEVPDGQVALPRVSPQGTPVKRTLPFGPDEVMAIAQGKAQVDPQGWLRYIETN